jgi:DNA-binding response OmpR family regulator
MKIPFEKFIFKIDYLSMKILVVDDDAMILSLIQKGLENRGHKVTTVLNGYEALIELDNENFDFILCDVFMPELSGFIVANCLKQNSHKTPLLFMSADTSIGNIIRIQYNSEFDFISKPISFPDLTNKIEEILKKPNPAEWN